MIGHLSKSIWGRRDSYHLTLFHHSTLLLREMRLGTYRLELKQRLYRNADDWRVLLLLLSYLFLTDQAYLPRNDTAYLDLDILYQLAVKTLSHICAYGSIWLRHFLRWGSLFPSMSNSQPIITITSLSFINLSNQHVTLSHTLPLLFVPKTSC